MEILLRTAAIYLFLLALFRLTGKRTLSETSTFDLVLLLILSEAVQNALVDDDKSVVTALAVVTTFVTLDLLLSVLARRFRKVSKVIEGVPLLLVEHGRPIAEHLRKSQVTDSDILQAARASQGLERMEQIKYALLENSGGISIIPADAERDAALERRIEEALRRVLREDRP